jgi:hypothetical protein
MNLPLNCKFLSAKAMKKIIIFIFIYLNLAYFVLAQSKDRQVFSSRGGTIALGGYEIDFTLGEVFISSFEAAPILLTQGFLQPMDFPTLSIAPLNPRTGLPIYTIYPNPTQRAFFIKLTSAGDIELKLDLFTIEGKQIQTLFKGSISNEEKEIEIALPELAPNAYLLCASFFNSGKRLTHKAYHKIMIY